MTLCGLTFVLETASSACPPWWCIPLLLAAPVSSLTYSILGPLARTPLKRENRLVCESRLRTVWLALESYTRFRAS